MPEKITVCNVCGEETGTNSLCPMCRDVSNRRAEKYMAQLEDENARLKSALDKINNIAVEFHETGPHDSDVALKFITRIYQLSVVWMENDDDKEVGDG